MLDCPSSLAPLLVLFRPCLSSPSFSFRTFNALCVGFLARVGRHTVTGRLVGAGLAGVWHHARAHRFSGRARWSADALGLMPLDLAVACFVGEGEPLLLAVDETLLRRSGRAVFGWYRTRHHPSVADMLARLRREIIAAQYSRGHRRAPRAPKIQPAEQTSAPAAA